MKTVVKLKRVTCRGEVQDPREKMEEAAGIPVLGKQTSAARRPRGRQQHMQQEGESSGRWRGREAGNSGYSRRNGGAEAHKVEVRNDGRRVKNMLGEGREERSS